MKIRVIGSRVFVRPLWPESLPDELISAPEIAKDPPTVGTIVAVGQSRCPSCDDPIACDLKPGMVVRWQAGTVVDDVDIGGEALWVLRIRDVLVEEIREEKTA